MPEARRPTTAADHAGRRLTAPEASPVDIRCGDALAVLPTLAAGSVDAVITDPPYNSGGRTSADRLNQSARRKYVSDYAQHQLADFAGDNRDQRGYRYWLALILAECLRISRPGSSCLVFTDWRQLPTTTDALQVAGWTWRGVVVWRKPVSRPYPNGFRREAEFVAWASNGPLTRHEPAVYLPGVVTGSQPAGKQRHHITQKPVDVMTELARICPAGGTILDPFTGSGSTGVAALRAGRRFQGVELSEHYASIAKRRLLRLMANSDDSVDAEFPGDGAVAA